MDGLLIQTIVIMLIGLVGAVLPVIPGPPIVWLGALFYAYQTNWTLVGWPALTVLLVLAVVGSTADIWMSQLTARRSGASGWATLASIVGGLVGLVVFSLPGALIGSLAGIAGVEYWRHRSWANVVRASRGYVVGWVLSMVVEVLVCLLMIALFIAAVNI